MQKIVHLFPYEKFSCGYINFINHFFDRDEHLFIVYWKFEKPEFPTEYSKNVFYVNHQMDLFFEKKNRKLVKALISSRQIIIHSLNETTDKISVLLPGCFSKSYICFWGYDIYDFWENECSFTERLWRCCRRFFVRHARGIITLVDRDYEVLNKFVKTRGTHFEGIYLPYDLLETLRNAEQKKKEQPLWIIVGNSATESNHHYEILQQLSAYKNEDIRIFVPLSYGDMDYADKVAEFGRGIFGDKFVPVREFMKGEEYWKFLSCCSIGFFNNNRQQALGNINALAFFGTKIYMRNDTAMWDEIKNKRKWIVFDIENAGRSSFAELTEFTEQDKNYNRRKLTDYLNPENGRKIWERIFL